MQVHSADAHLLGYHIDTQVGITDVLVNHLHHALHQCIIWSLNLPLFHLLLLTLFARKLIFQRAAHGEQVDDGAAQDVHVEWFQNVGICSGLQTFQLVFFSTLGGEQDDRHIVGIDICLQLGAEGGSVHFRHHHVADDEVWLVLQNLVQCHLAVRIGAYLEVAGELCLQIVLDILLVFHNHDFSLVSPC